MRKVSILGAQESGLGAALLARAIGWQPFVSDMGQPKAPFVQELKEKGIDYELGQHTESRILDAEILVKSPGIPDTAPIIRAAKSKGLEVISEIEFAGRNTASKIIAITGSNGKTTTTSLTYHILKKGGLNVGVCGNIGNSFARMVAEEPHDWYVIEISSFQLDNIVHFHPHISVVLNVYENHLNRYNNSMTQYADTKMNITNNQTSDDYFIYCLDSPILVDAVNRHSISATKIPFSLHPLDEALVYIQNLSIMIDLHKNLKTKKKKKEKLPLDALKLRGVHNQHNAMASAVVGRLVDIRKEVVRESLEEFESMPHRLESVKTVNGVEYINDSKATNVNAAWFAIQSMHKPAVWIVGGVDKGNDYGMILPLVKDKVKAIVTIGEDTDKIYTAFRGAVKSIVHAKSMEQAVAMATEITNEGDAVLLSPACASFDMFDNFEARGDAFKGVVNEME